MGEKRRRGAGEVGTSPPPAVVKAGMYFFFLFLLFFGLRGGQTPEPERSRPSWAVFLDGSCGVATSSQDGDFGVSGSFSETCRHGQKNSCSSLTLTTARTNPTTRTTSREAMENCRARAAVHCISGDAARAADCSSSRPLHRTSTVPYVTSVLYLHPDSLQLVVSCGGWHVRSAQGPPHVGA